ncbi:MAG: hypothetical protein IT198_04250 [Acidimicrobiia bacterium]|nr:hypothetical protein [Acidimicrobiia bacterium]
MTASTHEEHLQRYMHTACVLFRRAPRRSVLAGLIGDLGPWSYEAPHPGAYGWATQGPALVTTTPDGIHVCVDIVDRPFPDTLAHEPVDSPLLAAWADGEFGEHTLRGALGRSSFITDITPEGESAVSAHGAYVRIRTAKLGPDGHHLGENAPRSVLLRSIGLVTRVGARLTRARGSLAWFVPGGEVLASSPTLQVLDERDDSTQRPPVEVWVGVHRAGDPDDATLSVVTVGARQLGIDDVAFLAPLSPATWLTARVDAYDLLFDELESIVPQPNSNVVPLRRRGHPRYARSSAG